jgi:hypothetical protein
MHATALVLRNGGRWEHACSHCLQAVPETLVKLVAPSCFVGRNLQLEEIRALRLDRSRTPEHFDRVPGAGSDRERPGGVATQVPNTGFRAIRQQDLQHLGAPADRCAV